MLPCLKSLVPAEDLPKEAGRLPPGEEACVEDRGQSYSAGSSIAIPAAAPDRCPRPTYSEKRSSKEGSGSAHSACFSLKFSTSSYVYTCDEWQGFSYEELRYNCFRISPNRPHYNPNAQSNESQKRTKKVPDAKAGPEQQPVDEKKRNSSEKHAGAERNRRGTHKQLLIDQYQGASDYALETAGWQHKSLKPPTKEIILQAFLIHTAMREWLLMMANEEPSQPNWANKPRENRHAMSKGICEQCHQSSCSLQAPPNTPSGQNDLPFRATVQESHHLSRGWESSNPNFPIRNAWMPRLHPVHSTPSPSPPASFQSFHSDHTKRKREEDEEETTPTGPLRHAVAKSSPEGSPRSATSSRGSWYWVEKQL